MKKAPARKPGQFLREVIQRRMNERVQDEDKPLLKVAVPPRDGLG